MAVFQLANHNIIIIVIIFATYITSHIIWIIVKMFLPAMH